MKCESVISPVTRFADPNHLRSVWYRTGSGRSLGLFEKAIAGRTVSLNRDLTSLDERLVRRCLVASDQERKPT